MFATKSLPLTTQQFTSHFAAVKEAKAKSYANAVLTKIRKVFNLGSSNISASTYMPRLDRYVSFPGIITRNYNLESLLDIDLKSLADKRIANSRGKIRQFISSTEILPIKTQRREVRKATAASAISEGAGNCEELTTVAFLELLDIKDCDFSVELVVFKDSIDHTFLVLNRDYATDVSRWQTWNSTSVIFDPWLGLYYSPAEFTQVWSERKTGISPDKITIQKKFDTQEFLKADAGYAAPQWTSLQDPPIPSMGDNIGPDIF